MQKLVKEYAEYLNDDSKKPSERFWGLQKRINEDRHHPGVILEMRKSEAVWNLEYLIRLGVITCEDLKDFSEELQQQVREMTKRHYERE